MLVGCRRISYNMVALSASARRAQPSSFEGGSSSAVEHLLAKEGVAGSNPVFRSKPKWRNR